MTLAWVPTWQAVLGGPDFLLLFSMTICSDSFHSEMFLGLKSKLHGHSDFER